jgi:hypothetical protein
MRGLLAAAILSLALTGCVPTLELKEGADHERLVGIVRQFCQAEQSADPDDSARLFDDTIGGLTDTLPAAGAGSDRRYLTSGDPIAVCRPGRTWYRGGSRLFAEVRLEKGSDRLDVWRGTSPTISNVLYGRSRRVGGRKVDNLREALAATTAQRTARIVSPPPLPDRECVPLYYRFAFLKTDTTVYRQGAVVRVTPMLDTSPAGTHELPLRCVSEWSVVGPASLGADRASITIAPDAAPGSTVGIAFEHEGKRIAAELRVIGRDEIVLTGRYAQKALAGCQAPSPVGELEFTPGNRFSVTFNPFETYRDYWGTYTFDPGSKRIQFSVAGGNFVPPGLDLDGEADLSGGQLVLKGLFLGGRDAAPQANCTYSF